MKKFLPFILVAAGLLMAFNKPIMGLIAPATLELEISKPPVIMPCAYKVYANRDALEGKYSLFKMVVKNTSSMPAKNVEVLYSVTNYIQQTLAEKIPLIEPGQTVVVNCYPSFPDKIVEKMTDSKETVNILVKGGNIKTREENFAITIKGRNEFVYTFVPEDELRTANDWFDNAPLLSCLVTPNDPIIKYFTQKIQEKILKGDITNEKGLQESIRFLKGIYYATVKAHVVYGSTSSGVPEKDYSSVVQGIKLPREVISGKSGLCIELAILYASILQAAGLEALIFLAPGHAYPGFYLNNNYYAIESTGIGGEGIGGVQSPDAAFEAGMKNLEKWDAGRRAGDDRYSVVHVISAIKEGAVAMELKDDDFLRRTIDEIANSFDANTAQISQTQAGGGVSSNGGGGGNDGGGNDGGGGGGNGGGGSNIPSGYKVYQGPVTFAYPGSWRNMGVPQGFPPQCKGVISNSAGTANVQIYTSNSGNTPDYILQVINQSMNQRGYSLQYKATGQSNGYTIYQGQTGNSEGVLINWYGAFKVTGNGVAGVTIGAYANTGSTHYPTLTKILQSVQ
jgi:hypothetical protein